MVSQRKINKFKKELEDYFDPQKVLGYSKKKRKYVMKYPRSTARRKYWARKNKNRYKYHWKKKKT